jgi:glycerophosphoryl diester phosphodiesterase
VVEHDAAELITYDARKSGPHWVQPCPIPRGRVSTRPA